MKQLPTLGALLSVVSLSGCLSGGEPPGDPGGDEPPVDDECQIQTADEKSPGYPFNLQTYANEVLPVLTANCSAAGCHQDPGQGGFSVWAAAAPGNCEYAQTFNSMQAFVDLATPENSSLYVSITGTNPAHPVFYPEGDPKRETILAFVRDAASTFANDGGGGDPAPPGASPFDYAVYQQQIQPILDTAETRGCATSGCHGTGAGLFTLIANPAPDSPEMEANFKEVTRRTNLATPEGSLFFLNATTRHGGGISTVANTAQAQAILEWIRVASENAPDDGGTPPTCPPIEKFSVSVFRDEIIPLLTGDVDLNNPGGGVITTGCTRGVCHATDRGPGTLTLSAALTPEQNLQNFACFVDLTNPSNSQVLLCPLDDPRCRKSPHPGQTVFAGAQDLNYQRVLAYLLGSKVDATPLDFAFFVRRVNPIFNDLQAVEDGAQGRTCADTTSCHGVNVVGQNAPGGSNFPVIPNAADNARLQFNFASAGNFVNFLNPEESSLFLYPTNEIANTEDRALATGLPHPGGEDFAVDDIEALTILKWAAGLRPNNQAFVTDWLVAGDYPAAQITDNTPILETSAEPQIFDPTGAAQFNNGQWDGLFSEEQLVDLNQAFPRAVTNGRIAYAVTYLTNTSPIAIQAQLELNSPNALRVYVDGALVAQSNGGQTTAVATLPAFSQAKKSTRILVKVFQRADDDGLEFEARLLDQFGNLLTDNTGEIIVKLGPQGGI